MAVDGWVIAFEVANRIVNTAADAITQALSVGSTNQAALVERYTSPASAEGLGLGLDDLRQRERFFPASPEVLAELAKFTSVVFVQRGNRGVGIILALDHFVPCEEPISRQGQPHQPE